MIADSAIGIQVALLMLSEVSRENIRNVFPSQELLDLQ